MLAPPYLYARAEYLLYDLIHPAFLPVFPKLNFNAFRRPR